MPRKARLDAPGLLHHVLIRGMPGRKIFTDDKDRGNFLNRLSTLVTKTGTTCYAWSLLPGHAHFLFRSGTIVPLATLMVRLLTGYVVSFKHRHGCRGRLFRDRYRSVVLQEAPYLKELVRYIHLTPLRSGIVSSLTRLNTYRYSGHGPLMGTVTTPWQDVEYILCQFGNATQTAREAYYAFLIDGLAGNQPDDLCGVGLLHRLGDRAPVQVSGSNTGHNDTRDDRILGDKAFEEEIRSRSADRALRDLDLIRQGYNLERLIEGVGQIFSMAPDEIVSKGKQKNKVLARSLLCYWGVNRLGLSLTELAGRLEMSVPGVGYAVKRGQSIAQSNHYELPLQRHLL